MSKRLNLVGQKRGRLTFIEMSHIKNQSTYWKCKCDCGNYCIVRGAGNSKSCGCLSKEAKSKNGKNNKNRQTHKQYILSRIKIDSKTGCWNWTKALIKGYARIGKKGEDSPLASRYVCKYLKGIDPKGNIVCHTCDNPKCVNPDHLFIGTTLDNFKDMRIKGRSARGERNTQAKLTEKEVKKIRKLENELDSAKVAEIFDISKSTVLSIWSKKTWKHI